MGDIAIGIHGGCGTLERSLMSEAEWAESREHIAKALRAGWKILVSGGPAVAAVEATIIELENSPHFNAGYGAALTADSRHELDASIMDGATLAAGAVAGTTRIRNPITAARAVMEKSGCVLLIGPAADAFAERQHIAMVDNSYFTTERRVEALAALKRRAAAGTSQQASEAEKHGTVGAVARDQSGSLAAGTSTGGFNNKPVGRVGDSPIIGAGTYAKNSVCAVSCTGMGEVFIRRAAAYDVAARMMYGGKSLDQATAEVIDAVGSHGIGAGMVAIDAAGQVLTPFNTIGMYRGWISTGGKVMAGSHEELHDMGAA